MEIQRGLALRRILDDIYTELEPWQAALIVLRERIITEEEVAHRHIARLADVEVCWRVIIKRWNVVNRQFQTVDDTTILQLGEAAEAFEQALTQLSHDWQAVQATDGQDPTLS